MVRSQGKAELYEDQERDGRGRGLAGHNQKIAINLGKKIPKIAFTEPDIGIEFFDEHDNIVTQDDYQKKGGNEKVKKFTVPDLDSFVDFGKKMGHKTLQATITLLTKKGKRFRFSMEREDEHGILDRSVWAGDPRRQTAQYTFTHEKEGKDDQFFAPWEDLDISEESDEDDEESDEDSDESNGEDDDES